MSTPPHSSKKRKLDGDSNVSFSLENIWTPTRARGKSRLHECDSMPTTPRKSRPGDHNPSYTPSKLRARLTALSITTLSSNAATDSAANPTATSLGELTANVTVQDMTREEVVAKGETERGDVEEPKLVRRKGKKGKEPAKANNTIVRFFSSVDAVPERRPQPMHVRNRVFLEHAAYAYDVMMHSHRPPEVTDVCTSCLLRYDRNVILDNLSERFRCQDCLQHPDLCRSCVEDLHVFSPSHVLWKWDRAERLWGKQTVRDVTRSVINLGHGGKPCSKAWHEPYDMVIVHERGMGSFPVRFCGCSFPEAPWLEEKPYQLLAHGLFPGSWKSPRTAFTLPLL